MTRRASGLSVNDKGSGGLCGGGSARSTPRAVFSMMRAGTASSTMPSLRARRASTVLPVSMRSSAAGAPISSGSRLRPPQPGTMPSITSGNPMRELEPAAEAVAADQRERRVAHGREAVERVPAALDQRDRAFLGRDRAELGDVGAGDEAARLARADDEALRRVAIELVEHAVEFGHRLGRQR